MNTTPHPDHDRASSTERPAARMLHTVRPGEVPDPLATAWTADQLMALEFPPPKWAVPGVIPEGVCLLAGPPKVGKSWASLGLGLDIAAGTLAFGSIALQAGPVLYLALEDTGRRLQDRMGKVLAGQPAPAGLTLATTCPPLPQGGDEAIARWLERNPDARMVVIDVFTKIRGVPPPGVSAYEADYAAVTRVKKLADHYGVAIVLVHHVRKAPSEDFLAEVSGTNGIAGAADTILVLKRARGEHGAILHGTGRDVDEVERALEFDPASGRWTLLDGPANQHFVSDTRATILRYVHEHPGSTPKGIADSTGLDAATVRQNVRRMTEDQQLRAAPGGRYSVPDSSAELPV
jgi:hypothetical protein